MPAVHHDYEHLKNIFLSIVEKFIENENFLFLSHVSQKEYAIKVNLKKPFLSTITSAFCLYIKYKETYFKDNA